MVYQCPYCTSSFENEDFFRFHKYTHERTEELNILIPSKLRRLLDQEEEEEKSTDEDNSVHQIQTCNECGHRFYDNDELFRFHQEMHQSGGGNTSKISYTFQKVNERTYQKNKAIDRHYVVKLNSDLVREKKRVLDVQGELSQMFGAALQDATDNLSDSDFIRVVIHSDSLITNIVVPLRKIEHMTPQVILDHVNHVLTSHEDMPLDESFFLDIGTVQVPSGNMISIFSLSLSLFY